MKNKQILLIILIFLLTFVFSLFPITSFANNSTISTYSPHCIVMEASTGKVVYEKDAYSKVPPASTTKIMTAILALEHCQLTDTATVSRNAIYSVPIGYSHAYLKEGEILTIEQLLHVLLIPSANDAANVLAEHIAGSINSFTTLMNTKALELGCKHTNFVNTNGIQEDNHYSTAYDLAIMGRYAMQNETFRKIVSTTKYTLPSTNKYAENNRYFKNTNELILPDDRDSVDNYYYPYATGLKTGYTNAAKECIVASAKKDDKEFILVILGAERTENGLSGRFIDCKNLFNYAFENYTTHVINEENSILKQVKISNSSIFSNTLDIIVKDKITLLLKENTDLSTITPVVDITSELIAPISKNTIIGTITYNIDGNTYTSELLAGNEILESNILTTVLTIVSMLLVAYFLYLLVNLDNKKKSKSKKNNKDNFLYW